MYRVVIEKRVYKDLDRIPPRDLDKIRETIVSLEQNPRRPGSRKLTGHAGRYRVRQGDYRIVYTVDDKEKVVSVFLVRHRKDAYRDLE